MQKLTYWGRSLAVKALVCQTRDREFKSRRPRNIKVYGVTASTKDSKPFSPSSNLGRSVKQRIDMTFIGFVGAALLAWALMAVVKKYTDFYSWISYKGLFLVAVAFQLILELCKKI